MPSSDNIPKNITQIFILHILLNNKFFNSKIQTEKEKREENKMIEIKFNKNENKSIA